MKGAEAWNLGSSLSGNEVEAIHASYFADIRGLLFALSDRLVPNGLIKMLSPREIECLDLLSAGLRIKAIAEELDIKPVTVDLHLANARRKLDAPTTKYLLKKYWDATAGSGTATYPSRNVTLQSQHHSVPADHRVKNRQ